MPVAVEEEETGEERTTVEHNPILKQQRQSRTGDTGRKAILLGGRITNTAHGHGGQLWLVQEAMNSGGK